MIRRPEVHKKVWGQEEWIANTTLYCGKLLFIDFGASCSVHYHLKKTETFLVLEGEVLLTLDGEAMHLRKGDIVDVAPGQRHQFAGLTPDGSTMLEVSTQHFEDDSIRMTESTSGK